MHNETSEMTFFIILLAYMNNCSYNKCMNIDSYEEINYA